MPSFHSGIVLASGNGLLSTSIAEGRLRTGAGSTRIDRPSPAAGAHGRVGTVVALCLALALACAHRQGPTDLPRDDLTKALGALERKVCLTIGDRTNGPRDQCEPQVDRSTYLRPLREVFVAAPPILKAYLCSMDRTLLRLPLTVERELLRLPRQPDGKRVPEHRSSKRCAREQGALQSIGPPPGPSIGGPADLSTVPATIPPCPAWK